MKQIILPLFRFTNYKDYGDCRHVLSCFFLHPFQHISRNMSSTFIPTSIINCHLVAGTTEGYSVAPLPVASKDSSDATRHSTIKILPLSSQFTLSSSLVKLAFTLTRPSYSPYWKVEIEQEKPTQQTPFLDVLR